MQVVLAVVAAHQHLEHRLLLRNAGLEPLRKEPHDLLRDRGQRLQPRGPAGSVLIGREGRHLVTDAGQDAGTLGVDQRLVEPSETGTPGEVADRREPELRGPDQTLEKVAHRARQVLPRRRLGNPALKELGRQLHLRGGPLLRQEDPEHRLLQLRRPVPVGHAVVGEDPGQPVAELLREAAAIDVQALQVGVEVLPRAVHP